MPTSIDWPKLRATLIAAAGAAAYAFLDAIIRGLGFVDGPSVIGTMLGQ
jgi:hypothetical protein